MASGTVVVVGIVVLWSDNVWTDITSVDIGGFNPSSMFEMSIVDGTPDTAIVAGVAMVLSDSIPKVFCVDSIDPVVVSGSTQSGSVVVTLSSAITVIDAFGADVVTVCVLGIVEISMTGFVSFTITGSAFGNEVDKIETS